MFTGDRSGDFLYAALHRAGFASQPTSVHRQDGLQLRDCYITAAVRCAPPGNKPSREEMAACRRYLERELALLSRVRVVVALGRIAFDSYLALRPQPGAQFAHGAFYAAQDGLPALVASYHPSQQNTFTGRLTMAMLAAVFRQVRRVLEE
jgi:uracil-DNA glycosylase family 4